ncbi:2-methylcitrate dehydratase PrpD [Tamaricihabitans halophyticus]|uniref:2-methylcitrate dehydratase PrpD n=1 Tax=Tamaricihabitans halophyticus TaxID=1262583 RepID=A0A4R2PTN2_9PSEU|nr:MmgE/PrpD family protein [Tamaricihabitans halophyticus]TCP39373.1 2-methylcitrate dehydratase PrpD [Tamaricihabitans halophyticus]
MVSKADALAQWAADLIPAPADLALAQRSLIDTAAVALAAREHPLVEIASRLPDAARWSAIGHVLDFDDLHIESTTHISVVVAPAVLATGGDARAYLAGAGVMARLGTLLGWHHYASGWHATCTAGAPAAAVAAGVAMGLSTQQLATAIALAVPGAGGVQNAFGTHGKSLQVGFAAQAGVRAAQLARAGATAAPEALDAWVSLVAASHDDLDLTGPAVPGGLAIKAFPCCYAMQRPIAALREIRSQLHNIHQIHVRTPKASVHPLIHDRPSTGLEGKFSLPYALATAVLDSYPGFESFTDAAVNRAEAQSLVERVAVEHTPGGDGLLTGAVEIEVEHDESSHTSTRLADPPGAPNRPPTASEFDGKLNACGDDVPELLADATWDSVSVLLRRVFPRMG